MTILSVAVAFLTVLSLAEAVAIYALAREIGLLTLRLPPAPALESGDGPEIGESVPSLVVQALGAGESMIIGGPSRRPRVLLFLSSGCASCRDVLADLGGIEMDWPDFDFVPIVTGPPDDVADMVHRCRYRGFTYHDDGAAMRRVRVGVTPSALVVDADGRVVAQGVVNSREMVASLLSGRIHVNHDLIASRLDSAIGEGAGREG